MYEMVTGQNPPDMYPKDTYPKDTLSSFGESGPFSL